MKNGFTLVELSIVLIIVGLLVGGILVGQSLVSSAKMSSVISEQSQYVAAIRLFHAQFRGLPGDSSKAAAALGYGTWAGQDDGALSWDQGPHAQNSTEDYVAWKMLSVLRFIPNKAATSDGHYSGIAINKEAVIGINVPRSKPFKDAGWALTGYAGGYSSGFTTVVVPGSSIRLAGVQLAPNGTKYPQPWNGPLTVTESMSIDAKLDDGKPGTGQVIGHATTTALHDCVTGNVAATAEYNLNLSGSVCPVVFVLPNF